MPATAHEQVGTKIEFMQNYNSDEVLLIRHTTITDFSLLSAGKHVPLYCTVHNFNADPAHMREMRMK